MLADCHSANPVYRYTVPSSLSAVVAGFKVWKRDDSVNDVTEFSRNVRFKNTDSFSGGAESNASGTLKCQFVNLSSAY